MAENLGEEFRVKGEELLKKVKDLVHEGNIRRLIIKDDKGHTFMEIPLTFGVVGVVLAPVLDAATAPRLNGSGAYLDLRAAPETRRLGRLKAGESVLVELPPGRYQIAPGWWRNPPAEMTMQSGMRHEVVFETGEDGVPVTRVSAP